MTDTPAKPVVAWGIVGPGGLWLHTIRHDEANAWAAFGGIDDEARAVQLTIVDPYAGYAVVPVEPTEAMVFAGGEAPQMKVIENIMRIHQARGYRIDGLGDGWNDSAVAECYRAMLAASSEGKTP